MNETAITIFDPYSAHYKTTRMIKFMFIVFIHAACSLRQQGRITPYLPRLPRTDLTIDIPPAHSQLLVLPLHITILKSTETMATKQATVASFIESAPPGEVGRNGLPNE